MPTPGNNLNLTGSLGIVLFDGINSVTTTAPTNHNTLIGTGTNSITSVSPSGTSGIPLISNGVSADPSFSTMVVAGGGTGNTTFTAYSVICAGTTATGAFQNVSGVGTSGQVLTSNGAGTLPTWQASGSANPLTRATFIDDFVYANPTVDIAPWQNTVSGTGAGVNTPSTIPTNSFGLLDIQSGTTATGRSGICCVSNGGSPVNFLEANGAVTIQWTMVLANLSNSTDRFLIRLGLNDTISGLPSNGTWFQYSDNVNSGNWQINVKNSLSGTTTNNTTTAVGTTLTTLKITIDAANSSYHFYVNGSEVTGSPITTNIPTGSLMPCAYIGKSLGTTNRALTVDLIQLTFTPNSSRPG